MHVCTERMGPMGGSAAAGTKSQRLIERDLRPRIIF